MVSFSGDETAPLLRLPRRRRRPRLLLHGSGVRDGEERGGCGVDGGDASGAGHEVDRPRGHGRGARDLRADHRRHHQHRDQPQGQALLPLRRIRPPLLRPRVRPRGAVGRHGHRHRRRRWRQVKNKSLCSVSILFLRLLISDSDIVLICLM
ncbi:V-type proton ATPase 16 kDa proteolipid subunit [Iris pallida]|uniref:V-type proton ATPase 16 kDa proteolipid subunit n=1 Tax=Iris pallida TaxID=29817 RepID=A0AAX6HVD2_IRIPA|nr:V-type proton ATPase 16 kDa proteolipid subunit [Iris pallida]